MKQLICCLCLILAVPLFGQRKGVSPVVDSVLQIDISSTYAVVVGISDYQDDLIPDLRFADRDAEAFANFLRSPAGGELDEDHIKILTNEEATQGNFAIALYWLQEVVQEDDKVVIYFSGHSDVETKSLTQPGYLLCWDVMANVYLAGGTLALPIFQDVISTLSVQKKAKVLVITDACRAGKLAGSDVGGTQLTGSSLARQYKNENKILSCQPDEYSIEGEQWGGGRGAFSYHLLDGLYGMADRNNDQKVSLSEINRYLEDHVTPEVAPHSQLPMTVGDGRVTLATVYPELRSKIKDEKKDHLAIFKSTVSKGMEGVILARVDTSVRRIYRQFNQFLKDKVFLYPTEGQASDACADACYERLIKEPGLKGLHAGMTRNYAAALQDDAQQILIKWLNAEEIAVTKVKQSIKYRHYPRHLERAAELLGPGHYMYPVLQSRKLYFEGYLMHIDHRHADSLLGEKILAKYREALVWQPRSPHVYYSMSSVFFYQLLNADSAEYYAHKAVSLAPSWMVPYSQMGWWYLNWTPLQNMEKVRQFLELADQIDTLSAHTNLLHRNNWAEYYRLTNQLGEAEKQFKDIIRLDSTFPFVHGNLALVYLSLGRYDEAEKNYKKEIEIDSTNHRNWNNLGIFYDFVGRFDEAEVHLQRSIQLDSTNLWPKAVLAGTFIKTGRMAEAEELIAEVLSRDSTLLAAYRFAGSAYMQTKNFDKAARLFKMATRIYPNEPSNYALLGECYLFNNQYEAAEHQFQELIQMDPDNPEWYNVLGYCYLKSKRLEEAEQHFTKAIQLHDNHASANANLGLVYARMGRYKEAEECLEKCLELAPYNLKNVFINYTILYSLQGQLDTAFVYLEKALEKGYKVTDTHIDLMEEPALASLRESREQWESLLRKYAP